MTRRIPALMRRGGRSGMRARGGGGAPTMPDSLLSYWASDATTSAWANRGSLGTAGDLALQGTGTPIVSSDATGAFVSLAGTHRYETGAQFSTGYAGTSWTIAVLHDGSSTSGRFLFDFLKSGSRLTGRSRAGSALFDILDSTYRNYEGFAPGTLHYEVFVLSGATGNGYLKDDVSDSNNPQVYDPRVIDTLVSMAIGSAHGGSGPFVGKVRMVTIASGAWGASERAQAQAAVEAEFAL